MVFFSHYGTLVTVYDVAPSQHCIIKVTQKILHIFLPNRDLSTDKITM